VSALLVRADSDTLRDVAGESLVADARGTALPPAVRDGVYVQLVDNDDDTVANEDANALARARVSTLVSARVDAVSRARADLLDATSNADGVSWRALYLRAKIDEKVRAHC
jgi:hypothetical protein